MQITAADLSIDFFLDERARELTGEIMRWFDLVRTGKLLERVQKYNAQGGPNIQPYHVLRPIPNNEILLSGGSMKLSRVIAQAGGFAEFAKSSSVTVTRAGSHQSIKVDVGAIVKDGQMEKDIDLEDGDIVYVGGGML